jgi:hypothetical protein
MQKYLSKINKIFKNKLFTFVKLQSLLLRNTFNNFFFFFGDFFKEKKDLISYLGKYLPKIFIVYITYIFYFYFVLGYQEFNTLITFISIIFVSILYLSFWYCLFKFYYFCKKILQTVYSKMVYFYFKYYNLYLDIKSLFKK